jgi:hypothetical protein
VSFAFTCVADVIPFAKAPKLEGVRIAPAFGAMAIDAEVLKLVGNSTPVNMIFLDGSKLLAFDASPYRMRLPIEGHAIAAGDAVKDAASLVVARVELERA